MRFRPARALCCAVLVGVLAACSGTGDARIGRAADGPGPSSGPTSGAGADLMGLLVPYPAGAQPWTQARTGAMDLDAFVDNFYAPKNRASTRDLVIGRGFTAAARHGWFNSDGTQEDVWLVKFSSASGAASEYLSVTGNWKEAAKPTTTFAVPAVHGLGELVPTLDDLGNTSAKTAASRGGIFLYVRVFTPQAPDRGRVSRLAQQQYDALPAGG